MALLVFSLLSFLYYISLLVAEAPKQNFHATFSSNPTPFSIRIDQEFLDLTAAKLRLTRFSHDLDQPDLSDGPSVHTAQGIRDYWLHDFDWRQVETELNAK
jgi:hypothetical protein